MPSRPCRIRPLFAHAAVAAALVLVAAACGSSSPGAAGAGGSGGASSAPGSSAAGGGYGAATTAKTTNTTAAAAPATTAAAKATTAPASTPASAAATTAASTGGPACQGLGGPGQGSASADVTLVEWKVEAPPSIAGGKVTLNVKNGGKNKHQLVVVKGGPWAALPKGAAGQLDEAALAPGALVGKVASIEAGKSCTTTVDLAAGAYVFLCNITFGSNSHAAKGQVLDVNVTG